MKKRQVLALFSCLAVGAGALTTLAGCGGQEETADQGSAESADASEKTFTYGTTAYGGEGCDPHESYNGWSCIRYGIGETLVRIKAEGGLEPWLAESYQNVDEKTWEITIKDNVTFQNGKKVDAEAVKACLERLVEMHDRAPNDLQIKSMEADGQVLTVKTKIANPAFMSYLADPYGCIIDVSGKVDGRTDLIGTGPYTLINGGDEEVTVKAYPDYWNGEPKVENIVIKKITDGDTLTMAMQKGEIDATQGLPYASLSLFQDNADYNISSADTSRSFYILYNQTKDHMKDAKVRKAIACAIDKESFTSTLLNGNGTPAVGPFPDSFSFGDSAVHDESFDLDKARELLKEAGYEDSDGDGYVDKDGKNLTINWLTYSSRQELPLLAESAQATLKDVGVKVDINCVDSSADYLEANDFDVYAMANVSAPTGDPQYFFTAFFTETGSYNITGWHDDEFDKLLDELRSEFDEAKRSELAVKLQQILLDQNVITVASHLKMSFVMKNTIKGFSAHPSDYYEISADLDIA